MLESRAVFGERRGGIFKRLKQFSISGALIDSYQLLFLCQLLPSCLGHFRELCGGSDVSFGIPKLSVF